MWSCFSFPRGNFRERALAFSIENAGNDPRLIVVRLLVVGGTANPVYSELQPGSIKVQHRVGFCGRHDDIRPFFRAADAFVLPSRYEVFPAVTIEAAAGALPLITTRLNGVEEYAVRKWDQFHASRPVLPKPSRKRSRNFYRFQRVRGGKWDRAHVRRYNTTKLSHSSQRGSDLYSRFRQ